MRPYRSAGRRVSAGLVLAVLGFASDAHPATYYVRQTVGDDANDGQSPGAAWRQLAKLSAAMHAGDTAYVGPGLYRDRVFVEQSGTREARITFVADPTGRYTGDPPGAVLVTGAEPVDEHMFVPHGPPGVYRAPFEAYPVLGMVEMDGRQTRYRRSDTTAEHLRDGLSPVDVVVRLPATFFYDQEAKVLYAHTSDGQPPWSHEIELMRRENGIYVAGKHYVTVVGFTFRHMGDAGINFFIGSGDGVAIDNTAYGSRQGIRVYGATNILVYRNTLFRNENCGVYFAAQSTGGLAIGNTAYENVKGVRWSSGSVGGMALDNVLFNNTERAISIESTDGTILERNRMVNNGRSQLLAMQSAYASDHNCFENGTPDQLAADLFYTEQYGTLDAYRHATGQDVHSGEGECGRLPRKVAVRKLHVKSTRYADRARHALHWEARQRPRVGR